MITGKKVADGNCRFNYKKLHRARVVQCEVSAYAPIVVDAAWRRIGNSRHGGHKIAISPLIVNGFTNGFSVFFWS